MPIRPIRYYYRKLTPGQQAVYEQLLRGLMAHETDIAVTGPHGGEPGKIFEYVLLDTPALFYVKKHWQFTDTGAGGRFRPGYLCDDAAARDMRRRIDARVDGIMRAARPGMEKPDHLQMLYTWLALHTAYDDTAASPHSHTIAGPFLHGRAVCGGYAIALKYLCDAARLPCAVVNGTALVPNGGGNAAHCWNIVRLRGKNYHADVTWDSILADAPHFDYLGLSDAEAHADHIWDTALFSSCDATLTPIPLLRSRGELAQALYTTIAQGGDCLAVRLSKRFGNESEIDAMLRAIMRRAPLRVRLRAFRFRFRVRYNREQSKLLIHIGDCPLSTVSFEG